MLHLTNLVQAMLEVGGTSAAASGLAWAAERAHPSRLPLPPPAALLRDACLAYTPTRLLQYSLRVADRGLPERFELVAAPILDPTSAQTHALYEALATDQVRYRSPSHSWCVLRPGHSFDAVELPLPCTPRLRPAGPGLRAEWASLPCLVSAEHVCALSAALRSERLATAAVLHAEGTSMLQALRLAEMVLTP